MAALHHRERTRRGSTSIWRPCRRGSRCRPRRCSTGQSTHRRTTAGGNRADFGECAPHGIYPCVGEDRWVAIACRDDREVALLAKVIDEPALTSDRFATLAQRLLAAVAELDRTHRCGHCDTAKPLRSPTTSSARASLPVWSRARKNASTATPISPNSDSSRQWRTPRSGTVRVEGIPLEILRHAVADPACGRADARPTQP